MTVHARRVEIGQLVATHGICGIEVTRAGDLSNTLHEIDCGACVAALIAPDSKWVHVIAGYRLADEPTYSGPVVSNRNTQTKAADRLEELTAEMKALVVELREGTPDAYKKIYNLRRELGYVVATLGEGVPR